MATEMLLKSLQLNLAEAGEVRPWKATRTAWIKGAGEGLEREDAAAEEREEQGEEEEKGAALAAPPSSPCEETSPMADNSAVLSELAR
jgi:hypothetical protein